MNLGDCLRMVVAPVARQLPVRRWPASLGRIYGIGVPKAVVAHPVLSPRGSAHVGIVLTLFERAAGVSGDVAECGVFRGSTLVPLALEARRHGNRQVLGFDSFQGFDESVNTDVALGGTNDLTKRTGGFGNTSEELVLRKLRWLGLTAAATLVPGYFGDTLPGFADRQFCFVHLDCDLYSSYSECLGFFWPRMTPGGIILFDEYQDPTWPGCTLAIDEFFAPLGLVPLAIELDNYQRFYVVKPSSP